jgi:plastocyanin
MRLYAVFALFLFIIALVFLSGCSQYSPETSTSEDQKPSGGETGETSKEEAKQPIVKITSSGFTPKTLRIKAGETVKFLNEDSSPHWPASDIHPTHEVYPGSSISKCGTSEQSKIFDSCRGLAKGESFEFTFNEKGSWNYHDHLNPRLKGTIIVE